jgi:hypothetical protein
MTITTNLPTGSSFVPIVQCKQHCVQHSQWCCSYPSASPSDLQYVLLHPYSIIYRHNLSPLILPSGNLLHSYGSHGPRRFSQGWSFSWGSHGYSTSLYVSPRVLPFPYHPPRFPSNPYEITMKSPLNPVKSPFFWLHPRISLAQRHNGPETRPRSHHWASLWRKSSWPLERWDLGETTRSWGPGAWWEYEGASWHF